VAGQVPGSVTDNVDKRSFMYLVVIGVALVILKLADVLPIAEWPWWGVLLPFPVAAVWWAIADATGFTKKRATEREEKRRVDRMRKHMHMGDKKRS